MSLITIITPTYNRKHKLNNLFESLKQQEIYNFEWLIVDDGSTDDTAQYISETKKMAEFNIDFIKKENGGKHTALNKGIQTINNLLTIIVDSDDTLLPDATKIIGEYYKKYKNDIRIGAFAFGKCRKDQKIIVHLSKDEFVDAYSNYRIRKNRPGDMAEVFYTSVLKMFPFPEFSGEKFLSEDIVWLQISRQYLYVFINRCIYECEYLNDGLTANDKPMKFASPQGSMLRGKMLMISQCGLRSKVKGAIIYNCYRHNVKKNIPNNLKINKWFDRIIILFTKPLGMICNRKWNKY